MPHIVVDYSDPLSAAFDRRAFGLALHPLVADLLEAPIDTCKTRFRRIEEAFIADGSPDQAMVHIELAILSGRTPEAKRELSRAVLDLARNHVPVPAGATLTLTVDVTELDRECYSKQVVTSLS
ncbi:5-carboxymethyl-2-hydroxymuconate Delta-isomerase [Streptomyces sp. XD-27]|uniref:5-carboxymethyl-2-hydroxymuconate Delta-isomerase n=1 Tax=Streptomyces sp. XD-27 TaxID=3062779 RepID=UPI0026F44E62|nr:5-carboxymethyl-2-hydroxymuconate Delta-isomerase [Streptomyces sp. XD-27]WKX69233.1 5-carboxymethyl-2-hydroxymuconate Delta-isomerase [Streptomyces sp. XD-27]